MNENSMGPIPRPEPRDDDERFARLVEPFVEEQNILFARGARVLYEVRREELSYTQDQIEPIKREILDVLSTLPVDRGTLAHTLTIIEGRSATFDSFAQLLAELHLQKTLKGFSN